MEIGQPIDILATLQLAKPPRVRATGDDAALRKVAEEFEGFFVSQMLEQMFSGIETDGLFGGGQGEKVWRSFLMQEYGKLVAGNGGLGIADAVQRQLLLAQEAN